MCRYIWTSRIPWHTRELVEYLSLGPALLMGSSLRWSLLAAGVARHVCEYDHVVDSVRHSVVMSPSTGA